jgi:gas vesicle protein
MAENACAGDFLAGLLVGALVGAAAALLLAPQSGEQTRTLLYDKGVELGQKADDLGVEARQRAGEFQVRMKQAVDEGKATATQKKEELLAQVGTTAADEEPAAP